MISTQLLLSALLFTTNHFIIVTKLFLVIKKIELKVQIIRIITVYYHLIIKLNKNHYIYDQFSIFLNKFYIYILILKFRFSILILDFY